MNTLRLDFDIKETPIQVAQRASAAVNEGDYLVVDGYQFILRGNRVQPAHKVPKVYEVRPLSELKGQAPKQVPLKAAPKPPAQEAPFKPLQDLKVRPTGIVPGAKLAPKDARRRQNVVEVAEVLDHAIKTTKGRTIKFDRLDRYSPFLNSPS